MKRVIISLIFLSNVCSSYASFVASRPSTPEPTGVLFSYCPTVLAAVHTNCFMTKRCSQKCVYCRKWDIVHGAGRAECLAKGVILTGKCDLCDESLEALNLPSLPPSPKSKR